MARKSPGDRDKKTALGKALRSMFKALESRPVPDRLRSIVGQLQEPEIEDQSPKRKRGRS